MSSGPRAVFFQLTETHENFIFRNGNEILHRWGTQVGLHDNTDIFDIVIMVSGKIGEKLIYFFNFFVSFYS